MRSHRKRAEFDPDELKAALARYDLGKIRSIEPHFKGSRRSPKVLIRCERGRFLLKRRVGGCENAVRVGYAHRVQQHLIERFFPLPFLMPLRGSDDTLLILHDRIYEMFQYVPGAPYDRSLEATCDAGRTLGSFHALLRDFTSEWEPSRRGYHDSQCVRQNLHGVPAAIGKDDSVVGRESELLATTSALYELYETAVERVHEAGYREWPSQIVHADWHPGNMLFAPGKVAAVIDYDSLKLLPPVTDVANGVLQFSIIGGPMDPRAWPAELAEERLRSFLQGYEQEASLSPEQARALPWLMIEALIAEAVVPIAATGSFGRLEGFRFLQMICRKARWLQHNGERLMAVLQA